MRPAFKSLLIAALFGGTTVACSKPDSPSTNAAPPATSALPDLAKPETWDRKDRPFAAKGRVRVSARQYGVPPDIKCPSEPGCGCFISHALAIVGPRSIDHVWLPPPGEGELEMVNVCSGKGRYPQGDAEVEGTLQEGVFVLSKPPKYLNAPTTPAPSGSTP